MISPAPPKPFPTTSAIKSNKLPFPSSLVEQKKKNKKHQNIILFNHPSSKEK